MHYTSDIFVVEVEQPARKTMDFDCSSDLLVVDDNMYIVCALDMITSLEVEILARKIIEMILFGK